MSGKSIRSLDIMSSLFLFLFALFIAIESCRLGLGDWNNPGAGYFSFGAAVLLGVVSIRVLIKGGLKRPQEEKSIPKSEPLQRQHVFYVLASMVAYAALFDKIGFTLSTFLLMVFCLRVISPQRWVITLIAAFSCAAGSYLLFQVLLSAELPRGFLGL